MVIVYIFPQGYPDGYNSEEWKMTLQSPSPKLSPKRVIAGHTTKLQAVCMKHLTTFSPDRRSIKISKIQTWGHTH